MGFDKIVVEKDCLWFGDTKVEPPFDRQKIDAILGEPRVDEWECENFKGETEHYITCLWDDLGIRADTDNDDHTTYTSFRVYVADGKRFPHFATGTFAGRVMVGKKEYTQCKMKYDCLTHELKRGPFYVFTFLIDELDTIDEDDKEKYMDTLLISSRSVLISYEPPKTKSQSQAEAKETERKAAKYILEKLDEPVLVFNNFNFKLTVIEQLMYKKQLLKPRFDIYEFAEVRKGRKIDVEEDGYEPINAAKKWFKDLEIPASMADEVTELLFDGGLHVYHQIYPFWDGEDEYFDVTRISDSELAQFKNIKKAIVVSCISEAAIKKLKAHGVEIV